MLDRNLRRRVSAAMLLRTPRSQASSLVVAALAVAFAGCGAAPVAPPREGKKCEVQVVSLTILASPTINPTLDGEPRPVKFRIYQLKDDVRLQSARFEQVWKDDAAALATDIVKREDLFVFPNSRTDVSFERDPAAEHVVGVALFRNANGRSWFHSFALPPAPGKGDCSLPTCADGACGFDAHPRLSFWVDGARVDDGTGHMDDIKAGRRARVVQLSTRQPTQPPNRTPPPRK